MQDQNDHDLLIRVDTKLGTLINEMQLMRDGTNSRLERVESGKVDKADLIEYKVLVEKQMTEMRSDFTNDLTDKIKPIATATETNTAAIVILNKNMYIILGMGILLEVAIPIVIKLFFN